MTVTTWVLRIVAIAGLAVDAYYHLDLRGVYDNVGDDITQGQLFVAGSVAAIIAALALLLTDNRLAWAFAGLVALSTLGAVLLYRYVDVGAIGPIPNMHEALWYREKTATAVAEGAVVLAWAVREALRRRRQRPALPRP